MHGFRNFIQGGIAAQLRKQTLVHHPVVLHGLTHPLAQATGAGLAKNGEAHGLTDTAVPESFKGPAGIALQLRPESQASLLNQVQQQHAAAHIFLCNFGHPA